MALGARAGAVVALFVRQAVMIAVAGIGLGTLLTLAFGGLLASLLYGVSPRDPGTLLLIAAGVLALAVAAAALPASRAARADPVRALRQD